MTRPRQSMDNDDFRGCYHDCEMVTAAADLGEAPTRAQGSDADFRR